MKDAEMRRAGVSVKEGKGIWLAGGYLSGPESETLRNEEPF